MLSMFIAIIYVLVYCKNLLIIYTINLSSIYLLLKKYWHKLLLKLLIFIKY